MNKLVNKEYRLLRGASSETLILKNGANANLIVLYKDKNSAYNRTIRHCPNERSIYIDEQTEHARPQPIIFKRGRLEVPSNKVGTQSFLDAHPDNAANGGSWFEEVNYEIEAGESIEVEELKTELKQRVIDKSKEEYGRLELEVVVASSRGSFVGVDELSLPELKAEIYNKIDANPTYFTDEKGNTSIFEDDYSKSKYLVLKAIQDQIIKKGNDGRSVLWVNENKVIATAPKGIEIVDFFTDFLMTDEGDLVLAEITKRGEK